MSTSVYRSRRSRADRPSPVATVASASVVVAAPGAAASDFVQLTKPRLTTMVVITTLVGFLEGRRGATDWPLMLQTLAATFMVAGAASALNQWYERRLDARMHRTERRPLPAGRLSPRQGLWFGIIMMTLGALWLAVAANPLASALALITSAFYLVAYTPLKPRTSLSTVVGAVPGAIPPMIGWAASHGALGPGAWVLFAIVFFWQMPHFLAIASLYRDDYAAAGIRVLPVVDRGGASAGRQAVLYAIALLPVSLMPAALGAGGAGYCAGALLLGVAYAAAALRVMLAPDDMGRARMLFRVSLAYLPLLLLALVLL